VTQSRRSSFSSLTTATGRVGMWRGGVRSTMSVAAPFVWRCFSGSAITPFPHPPGHRRRSPAPGSHRTWRADFPHQRSSAVASQHCKRLQLPVGHRKGRATGYPARGSQSGLETARLADRSEGGITPGLAAVANAIVDALAEFGVEHIELPAAPERVWNAIRAARR
jgi:hypothetical protein